MSGLAFQLAAVNLPFLVGRLACDPAQPPVTFDVRFLEFMGVTDDYVRAQTPPRHSRRVDGKRSGRGRPPARTPVRPASPDGFPVPARRRRPRQSLPHFLAGAWYDPLCGMYEGQNTKELNDDLLVLPYPHR